MNLRIDRSPDQILILIENERLAHAIAGDDDLKSGIWNDIRTTINIEFVHELSVPSVVGCVIEM